MFTYTTTNKGNYILVRLYKKGHRGIYMTLNVVYMGDWNEVEYTIETAIEMLKNNQ